MKLIIFLMILSLSALGASLNTNYTLTGPHYNNGINFQGAIVPGDTYHGDDLDVATDVSVGVISARAIKVCAQTKGVNILFSSAGTAADGDDYLIIANTCEVFGVLPSANRLSVIQESATAEVYVTVLK